MAPEPDSAVFVGDLAVPRGLPQALASLHAPADEPLLRELELLDAHGSLLSELRPVAGCIACPQLTIALTLRHASASVHAGGWLDRHQAALAIPESSDEDAGLQLLCFPTIHLAYRLAGFLGLGPRPLREDTGAALVNRSAFEQVVGSGLEPRNAHEVAGLDDSEADDLLAPLSRPDTMHWRIVLADAATDGSTFIREAEAVDGGDTGLWLVGPAAEEGQLVVAPGTATQAWRLLATMLPSPEETEAIVAAQISGSARNRAAHRRSDTHRRCGSRSPRPPFGR